MIPFDEAELEGLVDFLRDCPGRISAAVVPGQETGNALIERLVKALPELTFEVMEDSATPGEISRRAQELGRSEDNVLVLRLDRRPRPESNEREEEFWRRLNYQRERLASGAVRSCLFFDESGNDRLALLADDLYEWVTFFRFPALAPRGGLQMSESRFQMLERPDDGVPADLDVLRDQWRRAREAGLPEQELLWNYTRPLFAALVRARRTDEASRFWKYELRDGDALAALPNERRLVLLLDACLLARYEDRDRFVRRAREYVVAAAEMLKRRRTRDSDEESIARALFSMGYMQHELAERDAARDSYLESVEIRRRLAQQHPAVFEPDVAMTLNNLGAVQSELGEHEAAQESLSEALEIRRRLAQQRPDAFVPDIATTLNNLGAVQRALDEHEAAQESYIEALEIRRRLAQQNPAAFGHDVADTLNNLGAVQRALGERDAARKSFLEALEIYRRLAQQHPAAFEPYVAGTLTNLGLLLGDLEKLEAARKCFAEAINVYAPLAEKYPWAFTDYLGLALWGYTSITPESEDDPWWQLWKRRQRQPEDAPTWTGKARIGRRSLPYPDPESPWAPPGRR